MRLLPLCYSVMIWAFWDVCFAYRSALKIQMKVQPPKNSNSLMFATGSNKPKPIIHGADDKVTSVLETAKTLDSYCDYIPDWLLRSCNRLGYIYPTHPQAVAFPVIFNGQDIILQSQTGSGKTLAYLLPILASIDPHRGSQAIIVAPTRELVMQICSEIKKITKDSPNDISVMPVMEGSHNRRQQVWVVVEPPNIIIGNPKALLTFLERRKVRLNGIKFVVVDEVDACLLKPETSEVELHILLSRYLSPTFMNLNIFHDDEEEMRTKNMKIKERGSPDRQLGRFRSNRQTIFCSATIPQRNHFADICAKNGWTQQKPVLINVSEDYVLPPLVDHTCVICNRVDRLAVVAYLLKQHLNHSIHSDKSFQCIVFVDEIKNVNIYREKLGSVLHKIGVIDNVDKISCLVPSLSVESRRSSLNCFRSGEAHILLCSDIASRGLDIPNNSLVIQMSLPKSADDYVHRAGRTGRFYRPGKVITLIQKEEDFVIKRYMNELGIDIKSISAKSRSGAKVDDVQ